MDFKDFLAEKEELVIVNTKTKKLYDNGKRYTSKAVKKVLATLDKDYTSASPSWAFDKGFTA